MSSFRIPRYQQLADEIERKINTGIFKAGDRILSVRRLHNLVGCSINTAINAFVELEKRGLVEARPKSGYYVKPIEKNILPPPTSKNTIPVPKKLTKNAIVSSVINEMINKDILKMGGALISPNLLPLKSIAGIIKAIPNKRLIDLLHNYESPSGYFPLRQRICEISMQFCKNIEADDIVITNGCLEAVSLCLQAVASKGDTIMIESPTYPQFLLLIEDLNLLALEIPTDPDTGVNIKSVESEIEKHNVKACILTPNYHNPLGFEMPDKNREKLVNILSSSKIAIIEDDIHRELHFGKRSPKPLKYYDKKNMVLYCSSISKTISPGLRIGWTIPGKFTSKVRQLKLNHSISSPLLNQYIISEYLKGSAHERHLRMLRTVLQNQVANMSTAIARYFPSDTRITSPKGGFVLWVELNPKVDGLIIYRKARKKKIAILPGVIFSISHQYRNCLRISCGSQWTQQTEEGVKMLGEIIKQQM